MFFDTHVHFDGLGTREEVDACLARAQTAGVTGMIAVGGSPEANAYALDIAGRCSGTTSAAVGYDRYCATRELPMAALDALLANRERVAAVGEVGLDFHYEPETRARQVSLFQQMLDRARHHQLPVIVHSRESDEDTLAVLTEHVNLWKGPSDRLGVLHSFTGGEAFARRVLDLGMHISFSGILTFRNADRLRETAKMVPDDRLLIETDSPYLAPVPLRGRKNEPAFVRHVAEALALVRGCSLERVAELTTANACRLFGLKG